jgi:hypothetical protein
MVYLVTWDLNEEKPNYNAVREAFIAHLERLENTHDTMLDSVRFVSTDYDATELSEYLRQKLDASDHIIVTELQSGSHQGWLAEPTWKWINDRI